jgi:hypothetical protein
VTTLGGGQHRGRRSVRSAALPGSRLIAAALLLASCGRSGDERLAAAFDDESELPLESLLGMSEATGPDLVARELAAQEAIRACMADAGHTYVPLDADAVVAAVGAPPDFGAPDSLDQVQERGYGLGERARADIDLLAAGPRAPGDDPVVDDPNTAARDRLPPGEQRAWDRALLGYAPDEIELTSTGPVLTATGEELGEEEWGELIAGGCQPRAYSDVFDLDRGAATRRILSAIDGELADMEAAFQADDRLLALQGDWSACMAGEGYHYSSQEDIFADLDADYDSIVSDAGVAGPTPAIDDRLGEAEEAEIAVATADWTCSQPMVEAAAGIRREYEIALIEDNEGLFMAYLDEVGE